MQLGRSQWTRFSAKLRLGYRRTKTGTDGPKKDSENLCCFELHEFILHVERSVEDRYIVKYTIGPSQGIPC